MTVGRAIRLGLAMGLLASVVARASDPPAGSLPAEVRVLSGPGRPTVLTVRAAPGATIEDRTPGARPPADGQGPASTGDTFSDEITFVVRGPATSRSAEIDVADALVSTVRIFPDPAGLQIVVFVRQPVTYSIARPTAGGAVELTLRPRTIPAPTPERPSARKPATPAGPPGQEDQVAVDAAELQYDQQANVLIARGNVTLTRGTTTLRADEVRYDRERGVAEARGNVVLVDPEATIEGDAARLDLNDETGWIDDVQADMRQSPYRLNAEHVEKKGGPCYAIRNGVFTTCRCGGIERPSWSIAAGDTDVTLNGVGVAKNATFRVKDTPVFYTPYLLFPANTERQTGFLLPRVSYSNRRGFVYEQPFFWAIDKSSDATITADIETEARLGVIGEYRYAWSQRSKGAFVGGYFNESIGGQPEPLTKITSEPRDVPEDRWIVAGRHRTRLPNHGSLYLDVLRISDDDFLREIRAFASNASSDVQIRSQRLTRSRLGLFQPWEGGAVHAEATSYQDLIDPQEFALDRLPRIAAEHSIPLLGGLAVARVPGEAVNFRREEGFDGLRFDLAPEVFVPFRLSRYLYGSVRGQVRETAYHLNDTGHVARVVAPDAVGGFVTPPNNVLPDIDRDKTREIAQIDARLATELARVFRFPYLGLDRIRHSIEPEIQYLFVPQVGRDFVTRCADGSRPGPRRECLAFFEAPYLFDEVDAINRRNFLSYGVTTRILGRTGAVVPPTPAEETIEEEPRPEPDDEDEEEDDELLDTIDPDTVPQGLPAQAIPPFVGRAKGRPRTPAVTGGSRELARLSLLQGYDISREIGAKSHLSDVDALFRVTPVDWAGFSFNTTIDVEEQRTLAQSIGLILREPWWQPPAGRPTLQSPSSIGIAYRFVGGDLNAGLPQNSVERLFFSSESVENVTGSVYVRVGDYVGFGFLARYSLTATQGFDQEGNPTTIDPGFLEQDYFIRLTSPCNCWAFEFGVSDRADTGETTTRAQLVLYGLGSFGQGPSRRGYAGLTGLQGLGVRRPWALGRE
jgi:LPS-assembly protein